ncbi:hypothetical protein [Roseivirga sp.]|uniref:hypothetical protein n=1 Tax=Roseivirga sp. TaxID=1964215 RepID=UPI003B8D35D7
MRLYRFISIATVAMFVSCLSQGQTKSPNEKAEEFILKVMREYKNPMAYYPLNKDIFLPTEEEIMKSELKYSYPDRAVVMGSFIFLKKGSDYKRELFVDAKGNRLFDNYLYPNRRGISLKANSDFFKKKQQMLNGNPNVGKFLLFNEAFKKD